eukprot:COSAG06_NODE_8729_length_2086_cov_2.155149_2_plen_46_part_01
MPHKARRARAPVPGYVRRPAPPATGPGYVPVGSRVVRGPQWGTGEA